MTSSGPGNAAALKLVLQNLSQSMVYTEQTNFECNVKLWDQYAKNWSPTSDFVSKMADNVARTSSDLVYLGDEWSNEASLHEALSSFLYPELKADMAVAELGVGGGRIAARTHSRVKSLACFDISEEMLKRAKASLKSAENVSFTLLSAPKFSDRFHNSFDFVYSFDVLPHVDLHTMFAYFREFQLILKPHGRLFLHTANLAAPKGWERFAKQSKYTAGGFYFITPETVRVLAANTGFRIVKESAPQPDPNAPGANIYFNRDYLCILERTTAARSEATPAPDSASGVESKQPDTSANLTATNSSLTATAPSAPAAAGASLVSSANAASESTPSSQQSGS